MTATPRNASHRFDAAVLAGLDEPVRRYFTHALTDGAPVARRARLRLRGEIKVGAWLRFDSVWEGDARYFAWRTTCGPGRLRPLRVRDQFADGVGFMDIRLRRLQGLKLLHVENDDSVRPGAGRAALEALWVPGALLPDRGVEWRAESHDASSSPHGTCRPTGRGFTSQSGPTAPSPPTGRSDGGTASPATCRSAKRCMPSAPSTGRRSRAESPAGWGHRTPSWAPFFRGEIEPFHGR